tara:strand:+ start:2979 stop:3221 length:243 start_codon:yes stop_codon:yes gene_type:complete
MIKKKLPGMAARLRHLANDMKTVAKTPGPVAVSVAEKERRLAICSACGYFQRGWCTHQKCGCNMRAKTWLSALRCPDGRW